MTAAFVVTMVGPDRPGLVNELSERIADAGGDWEGSRFLRLGGRFAGVAMVEIADAAAEPLAARLTALGAGDLHVSVERAHRAGAEAVEALPTLTLDAVGPDRAGVVRDLSHALSDLGVNIDELATDAEDASMAGGRVFRLEARLRLPAGLDPADALAAAAASIPDFIVEPQTAP